MITIYTVSAKSLNREADRIERYAEESLTAWILLRQSDRYSTEMAKARAVRAAARERNISVRREILRNSGYTIKSPKTISAFAA